MTPSQHYRQGKALPWSQLQPACPSGSQLPTDTSSTPPLRPPGDCSGPCPCRARGSCPSTQTTAPSNSLIANLGPLLMLISKKKERVLLSGVSGGRRDSRIFCSWTLQRLAETQIPPSSQLLPPTTGPWHPCFLLFPLHKLVLSFVLGVKKLFLIGM